MPMYSLSRSAGGVMMLPVTWPVMALPFMPALLLPFISAGSMMAPAAMFSPLLMLFPLLPAVLLPLLLMLFPLPPAVLFPPLLMLFHLLPAVLLPPLLMLFLFPPVLFPPSAG